MNLGREATVGMKVRYVPSDSDAERAKWGTNTSPIGLLDPEQEYTVERVEVHSWHTKVWLEGFTGPFNSTHFRKGGS